MIQVENLTKKFLQFTALDSINFTIDSGCIYGVVGVNGSGKSTLLRLISGIYRPDSGNVLLDGSPVWENPEAKSRIAYISDEPYFESHASLLDMEKKYGYLFPRFDKSNFDHLIKGLSLDKKQPINTFSKGMKRQAATALALSLSPDYILFDETFDGLDPIMRSKVKGLISESVIDRGAAAVMTSHSLRELEDTCDRLALLHKGGLVLQSDISDLKTEQFKIQIAFDHDYDISLFERVDCKHYFRQGSVSSFISHGDRQDVVEKLKALHPTVLDVLPLSLEEIFTYELEALGYTADPVDTNAKGGMGDEK